VQISYKGKVRDVYDLGDKLFISSSDRISAFDVVFNELILGKGIILNSISNLWFEYFKEIPNHILETKLEKFPTKFQKEEFRDRSILVKKCKRVDYECVVRGYISGSAFKEYKEFKTIAKKNISVEYKESEKLIEPIFTPAIKNDIGHDENISEDELESRVGKEIFTKLKNYSIEIYTKAQDKLKNSGLVLCDTKFEFGFDSEKLILIDELLTPDSSRYWDLDFYQTGISPPSYDKQILRNYLETLDWNKNPPAPKLPNEIIEKILTKYKELQEKIKKCL
jgi:phosphoribosylaminoimidazole-succinocarboxamide synthase